MMNVEHYSRNTIVPSRTKFQLEHFVIGQHDTKPMQWRQLVLEAQDLSYNIKSAELTIKKLKLEIDRLRATGDPLDAIEAEQKELDIKLTERVLAGALLELEWINEIAERVGVFTTEQIESNQHEYWQTRLQKQADVDVFSSQRNVSQGNILSMINAGLLDYNNTDKLENSSNNKSINS